MARLCSDSKTFCTQISCLQVWLHLTATSIIDQSANSLIIWSVKHPKIKKILNLSSQSPRCRHSLHIICFVKQCKTQEYSLYYHITQRKAAGELETRVKSFCWKSCEVKVAEKICLYWFIKFAVLINMIMNSDNVLRASNVFVICLSVGFILSLFQPELWCLICAVSPLMFPPEPF